MKLHQLNQNDTDRLRFEARSLLTGICNDIVPTDNQLYALRCRGFVIGKDMVVLRYTTSGHLRECLYGIPCTYYCNGLTSGVCKNIESPSCGIANGACLFNNSPCNSYCKNIKESDKC